MPEKIQIWFRINGTTDSLNWEEYDGRRLDLLHPTVFYDNEADKYNDIVIPDRYMFVQYMKQV